MITFSNDVSKVDVRIYLVSDGIMEEDEVFTGVLSHDTASSHYVEIGASTLKMTINDHDCELMDSE